MTGRGRRCVVLGGLVLGVIGLLVVPVRAQEMMHLDRVQAHVVNVVDETGFARITLSVDENNWARLVIRNKKLGDCVQLGLDDDGMASLRLRGSADGGFAVLSVYKDGSPLLSHERTDGEGRTQRATLRVFHDGNGPRMDLLGTDGERVWSAIEHAGEQIAQRVRAAAEQARTDLDQGCLRARILLQGGQVDKALKTTIQAKLAFRGQERYLSDQALLDGYLLVESVLDEILQARLRADLPSP
ncbi:MAG: hypothetical protein ACYS15_03335 [Planctomycetota bacterium]